MAPRRNGPNRWHDFTDDQKAKIILLRTVYGLTVKTIAERFSVSPGAVVNVLRGAGIMPTPRA